MCVAGWHRVRYGVWGFGIYPHLHFEFRKSMCRQEMSSIFERSEMEISNQVSGC